LNILVVTLLKVKRVYSNVSAQFNFNVHLHKPFIIYAHPWYYLFVGPYDFHSAENPDWITESRCNLRYKCY